MCCTLKPSSFSRKCGGICKELNMLHVASVALLLALASGCAVADESSECPNWYHRPPGSHHCQCGPTLEDGIMCSDDGVYIRVDYIMTWDSATNQTVAALSNYGYVNYSTITHKVYTLVPNDSQDLNEIMCVPNNREGFLCEDCVPGYGPTAYSPKCMDCRKRSTLSAIAIFLTLKLTPITVMFIVLIVFRINVTQGPLFGYVLYCQGLIVTMTRMILFYQFILHEVHGYGWILQISVFLSSIWAADFSLLVGNYCISESMKIMDVFLLNFVQALCPLLLVISTYIFIELHARNFRPFVIMWKPFNRCFAKIRRNWSATDSIIHAYATLFILSFATLNYNATRLLESTNVYNSTGKLHTGVLLYRPSTHVYSPEYIHYLVIVLTLMFFLGVCPTALLCIYSIKMLRRKFNNCCSHRIQIAFNTFVETFHGTFKDGLNGTRDYRVLPALFAIVVMFSTILASLGKVFHVYLTSSFMILFVISSFLIAFVRPCKSFLTNLSLSFHLMWLAAGCAILINIMDSMSISNMFLPKLFAGLSLVPHTLMISWATYKLLHNIRCVRQSVAVFKIKFSSLPLGERLLVIQGSHENLLPDRLENSSDYRELPTRAS